ncbi:MAG TPA: retroviral-like aspartic protease family protein [Gammaproteobacteria bacterium]|jgi:clan AA aspartic protease (TIGR02281 family)|nr:retroviral-like aspartic protease family protein [Gammaproteobacteria bacterium]
MDAKRVVALIFSAALLTLAPLGCSENHTPPTELKKTATDCMQNQDYECAEENWQDYLRQRPDDSEALAALGIAQDKRDENEQAIVTFQKAVGLGEGTYDLFYYYADSLAKTGKTDEAIDWYYKTLTIVPTLVDARSDLAKLLVQKKRYYEALALLASFDEHLIAMGQQPYFDGQRIAIETAMQQSKPADSGEKIQIKLFKMDGNFVAPVALGEARVTTFVVDTGATLTTMSDKLLQDSKTKYEVVQPSVIATTADGRRVRARLINLDSMEVAGFGLKDVPAMVCTTCQLLLGQQALSRFNLSSSKVQGVEFMMLKPRKL